MTWTTTPLRPLRAVRIPARPHGRACAHAWPLVPPSEWNDAQRARCAYLVGNGPEPPEFTEGCEGCEDLIGWRQWMGRRRSMPG